MINKRAKYFEVLEINTNEYMGFDVTTPKVKFKAFCDMRSYSPVDWKPHLELVQSYNVT
jgi:hypothetical protein